MKLRSILIAASAVMAMIVTACPAPTTQAVLKTDAEFAKTVASSDSAKATPPDFLAGEKLPNEEFVPLDTSKPATADSMPAFHEFPPTQKAKFRIQVFAGSNANAAKNYNSLSADTTNHGAVFMLHDSSDTKWRVWVGNYQTHEEAEKAKQRFIQSGFPDAWIHEMKGPFAPAAAVDLFWVQLGSFTTEASAQKARSAAESKISGKMKISLIDKSWKLWGGGFPDRAAADELKKKLQGQGYPQCFVVKGSE